MNTYSNRRVANHLHGLIFELKERMDSRQDRPVMRPFFSRSKMNCKKNKANKRRSFPKSKNLLFRKNAPKATFSAKFCKKKKSETFGIRFFQEPTSVTAASAIFRREKICTFPQNFRIQARFCTFLQRKRHPVVTKHFSKENSVAVMCLCFLRNALKIRT
jgi:hypothetical protein